MLTAKSKKRRKKMEKEKQQSSIRLKIVALVISLLVCFTLIGISVWAATQQNVTIDNTINISTSGNTRVAVTASEASNKSGDAVSACPSNISSWAAMASSTGGVTSGVKPAGTDSAEYQATAMNFSVTDGKNWYAYKLDFTNESTVAVYAHISSSAVDNSQITIYYGSDLASMSTLTNNKSMDTDVTLGEADGGSDTATFYVVVASKVALTELTDASPIDFDLTVTIDQTSG